jgi:hypothetical protein
MHIQVSDVNKEYYGILCCASSSKKPKGSNAFLQLLNKMLVKSRPHFPEFFLRDYAKTYIADESEVHLYLVSKASEDIIGHVMGTLANSVQDEIILNQVEVSLMHRNKRVCSQILVPTFVQFTGTKQKYQLLNTGGSTSCKCYQSAFGKMGYAFEPSCPTIMTFTKK